MKRKFLSVFLVLMMVLTMIPAMSVTAFAGDGPTVKEVANAGDLQTTINGAAAGDTIKLTKDININDSKISINKNLTIDLNGKALIGTSANKSVIEIDGDYSVIIKGDKAGSKIVGSYDTITARNNAKVTIKSGTYESSTCVLWATNGAEITVENGTVKGRYFSEKEGKIFYSGTPSGDANSGTPGKIIVKGGNFTGRISNSNWGQYEISGGTFDRNVVINYNNPTDAQGKMTGTSSQDNLKAEEKEISLTASGFIKDGYYVNANADGTYTVVPHKFTYSAIGSTIVAKCSLFKCNLPNHNVSIKLTAKNDTYTGTEYKYTGASLSSKAWEAAGLTVPQIEYVGRAGTTYDKSTTAPEAAGKYTALITVNGKTAKANFEIYQKAAEKKQTVKPAVIKSFKTTSLIKKMIKNIFCTL